jgi:putative ABC transport system ATP-binding protein
MTTTTQIECVDLVRIFSAEGVEVQALQGLNLVVDKGELTAIVGASGSGKSTLLSILSGLDVPTAGSARVAGHDLLAMDSKERTGYRRHTAGFVWQQTTRNLLPYLTIAENVALALAVAGTPRRVRDARITDLLGLLGITEQRDRIPVRMSGGEQQRAAIAVALANAPEVLFADEPTGELDEVNSALVLDAMRDVNERLGVTVLIVTHDPGVSTHVRRTVQIRDGRTSTEVLRSTTIDAEGNEQHLAEEYAVLDRVGRLQLPQEYLTALDLRERVRLELEATHIEVHPTRAAADDEEVAP